MRFTWSESKARANLTKHGVAFEDAAAVFLDPLRVDFDASHPDDGEVRRKVLGAIDGRVLSAVYTLRDGDIRLISVRRANTPETRRYER